MNINLTLLRNHVLGNDIQICKRLVHEGCHIIGPLKNLGVHITINKVQQLVKYLFNVADFVKIGHDQRMLGKEFLLFLLESFLEFIFNFLLFVLQLFLEIKEPLVDIFHLLEFQPFQFFLDLFKQLRIFVVQSLSIQNHFL